MAYKRISPQPIVEGGTGASTLTSNGVLLGNGTSAITATTPGTTGQVLTGVTGSAPTFQAPAASSISITGDTGGALTGNAFTFTGGTTGLSFGGSGTTETVSGTLIVGNGGTGRATLTNHGVLIGAGTAAITQLSVGTNGQVLVGSSAADPVFATLASSNSSITYTPGAGTLGLTVTQATTTQLGGTTLATNAETIAGTDTTKIVTPDDLKAKLGTQTAHSLLVAEGTSSALTALGVASNGQLPIGSAGADPVLATISAGTNISVTNGAGSITIATAGLASFTWQVITANQTAVVNNGYIANKAGTLALLLPAVSAVGDTIRVTGINTATGWQITQNGGNQIFVGSGATSAGAGGSITSTAIHDALELICVTANANWQAVSWVGNLTIV